jgi:hypothetical protein
MGLVPTSWAEGCVYIFYVSFSFFSSIHLLSSPNPAIRIRCHLFPPKKKKKPSNDGENFLQRRDCSTCNANRSLDRLPQQRLALQSIEESHSAVINAEIHPVYNVADYAEEHPGGIPLLLEVGGKDGTQAFEDVGHSDDAREMLEPFLIGEVGAEVCDFKI